MAIVPVMALGLTVPEQAKAQTCNGYSSAVPDPSRGWTATWFDDFNSFDATKWSRHESTNEAMHANAIWVPSKVTTSGGNLHINGEWNTATGGYISGFVSTLPQALNFQVPITASHPLYAYREGGSQYATQGFSFKYGLVEFCAKLPRYLNGTTPTTAGIHSSLWLMPTDLSWPPEIDVADAFNEPGNNGIATSLPYLISGIYPNNVNWPDFVADALAMDPYINQYALYALEWTDSELRFFINNTLVRVFNSSSPAGAYALGQMNSKAGFYLLMDQSLAEIYHQPFQTETGTSDLAVDWVKVYYSPSSPAGWTSCANEWSTCFFSGTRQVRFGVGTTWTTQTATDSIACDFYTFGDPAFGQLKTCQVESSSPTWTPCANEWGTCSFSGTKQVRFGVGTTWNTQTATDSIACDFYTFGDPAFGQLKTCQVESSSSPTWTPCANEWGTCSFSGTRQVRFGVGTTWNTQTATDSIACDFYTFGDPAFGQLKTCQVESSSSPTSDPLRQ